MYVQIENTQIPLCWLDIASACKQHVNMYETHHYTCWTKHIVVSDRCNHVGTCVCLCVMKVQQCHHRGDWGGPRFMDNKEILHNVVHCWTMSYIVMPNHSRPSPILCVCLSVCHESTALSSPRRLGGTQVHSSYYSGITQCVGQCPII